MMRLQMVTTRPVVWIFGDEAANSLRDSLKVSGGVDIDLRCYAYTGATLESVRDAQLLMALGSGTLPTAIIVVAGAYDALIAVMAGGNAIDAAAQITSRLHRLESGLHLRGLNRCGYHVSSSLLDEELCNKIGLPLDWVENVCDAVWRNDVDQPVTLDTLLMRFGIGKDARDESS
ncbi:MAG: hypothetical protein ACKO14_13945 [Armatimonadota bacterium]